MLLTCKSVYIFRVIYYYRMSRCKFRRLSTSLLCVIIYQVSPFLHFFSKWMLRISFYILYGAQVCIVSCVSVFCARYMFLDTFFPVKPFTPLIHQPFHVFWYLINILLLTASSAEWITVWQCCDFQCMVSGFRSGKFVRDFYFRFLTCPDLYIWCANICHAS